MLFFALLFITIYAAPTTPCKVAFRLDDIQDGYLVDTQQQIINAFVTAQVPLTVGIITSHFGSAFDPNTLMVPFLQSVLAQPGNLIEIASHTVDHIDLASQNYSAQIAACNDSKIALNAELTSNPRPIVTMICPNDLFDQNTLDALRATGYTTIAAADYPNTCNGCDGHNFYSGCTDSLVNISGLVHTPAKAQTSYNGNGTRVPTNQTLADMETSINACGFSVVEMHFVEFSSGGNTLPSGIADINTIINTVKSWGCDTRMLSQMVLPNGPITPTPTPTPSPTPTSTPTLTPTPTPGVTPTPTPGVTPTPTPSSVPVPAVPGAPTPKSSSGAASQPLIFLLFVSLVMHIIFG